MKNSELYKEKTGKNGFYSIQAISNIPSIIQYGILSNENAQSIVHKSIALQDVQQKRDNVKIPNGMKLHQYANLYFDFWNPMLSKLRSKNNEICILKIDATILDISNVIVSDRNATSNYVNFYTAKEGISILNFKKIFDKYWVVPDYFEALENKAVKCAEILVPNVVPFDYIIAVAVINEKNANILKQQGMNKRIIVQPSAFFGGNEDEN